jgi:hypothetical protein
MTFLVDTDSLEGGISVIVYDETVDARKQERATRQTFAALGGKAGQVRHGPFLRVGNVLLSVDPERTPRARSESARRAMRSLDDSD